jgi:hypothetical protein
VVNSQALATARKSIALDGVTGSRQAYAHWARALNDVNQHITVPQEEIDAAAEAYTAVAHHLRKKLDWPEDAINVLPQGSASTQTLIRSPDRSKFDIDAVCQVDISRIDAKDPVGFFNTVGEALRELSPTPKKRCWNIDYTREPFYLEFTPSVPIEKVPPVVLDSMAPRFRPTREYLGTALAVVDNPTKQWKTSNPAGLSKWVDDTAKQQLIRQLAMDTTVFCRAADVAPVPNQEVEVTDTLRVAIRLFKRHRDICVHRNHIEKDFKPISIIIVTLLTACYAGLADLGRTYAHPVELLADLADLIPGMVHEENGKFRVDNPTVPGENFAERWNEDDGERRDAFITWCDILAADMRTILAAQDEQEIERKVRTVFGCGPDRSHPGGPEYSVYTPPSRRPPPPAPRTSGLA